MRRHYLLLMAVALAACGSRSDLSALLDPGGTNPGTNADGASTPPSTASTAPAVSAPPCDPVTHDVTPAPNERDVPTSASIHVSLSCRKSNTGPFTIRVERLGHAI